MLISKVIKDTAIFVFIFMFLSRFTSSQTIPYDSLYLGQMPPERIPKRFNLSLYAASFADEGIAISNDGKEIFYTEVINYYPATGDTIKYFKYSGNQWSGQFKL